ncbi:alpha/beta hydrolase [Massilia yuzhufengensis]|uniref:Predicted hydrolase of the alpha/beta superfamily n=1 Tax=Massilia yuzhufengensis TaxID=1164594 RepID=A0A1I1IGP4_9BURK|nr:alpha/beta hydrolase-fold protein [Massilia yuzhufengensis]SFC32933.1 Predicted hydrolase of the alpha/beta superfamily [Massilia yuzhufengensis]
MRLFRSPATPFIVAALAASPAAPAADKPEPAKASTALPGVSLLGAPLDMPGLERKRQLRLYLPPGYATSGKRYPVLYMHDGQNLFDVATAYAGEWQVDETLDALAREGKLELIVVGIDNGGEKRMTELNAWDSKRFGAAEGREYTDFVVKTVKPLVDRSYRTLPGREHTAIMGSSMGGLASHYALAQYPQVFSKAGVFSPAYWTAQPSFAFVAGRPAPKDARVFMLMGEKEGPEMVADVKRMAEVVQKSGHPAANTRLKIVPGAEHNEKFWAGELREALLWMFAPVDTTLASSHKQT